MLDDKKIEILTERVVNRLTKANTKLLEEIGKKINLVGSVNPSDLDKVVNMLKYGGDYETIIAKLMKATGLNSKDLLMIFDRVAEHNLNAVKDLYKYRNKEFIPYKENQALQSIVKQVSEDAVKDYLNLSNTLGFRKIVNGRVKYETLRETYVNAIDEGVLAVRTGTTDYNSAMKSVVKELGESGVRTVDYASGYSRRLDTTVRMNIQDSIMRLHNETQKHLGEELGTDGIELSVHQNPAPDHLFQGKQFTKLNFEYMQSNRPFKDVKDKEYEAIDRPISTMNCRHITYSIILGISKPRYSDKELQNIIDKNNGGFTYKGKHYTNYEGTQLMRAAETKVREQQDIKAMGNIEATTEADKKIRMLMKEYNEIAKVSGLQTRKERLK